MKILFVAFAAFAALCMVSSAHAQTIKICFEAESATSVTPSLAKMLPGKNGAYSGHGFIDIPIAAPAKVGLATYKINVVVPGKYYLFARTVWAPGKGNSILVSVNNQERMLGEDGTYARWHWTSNSTPVRLKKGINTFVLTNRETGVRIDQFFLTNDSAYEPAKIRAATHDGATGKPISPIKTQAAPSR